MTEAPRVQIASEPSDACAEAAVLLELTEWGELRWIDLGQSRAYMASTKIVDTRNLTEAVTAGWFGLAYEGVAFT